MSVYDDVKKAIQDFIAPDMKALRETVEQNEQRAVERHDNLKREIAWRFDSLKESFEFDRRLDKLQRQVNEKEKLKTAEHQ